MGNKHLTCLDCNNKKDNFNFDLPNIKGLNKDNLSLIQNKIRYHLFHKKQNKFLNDLRMKTKESLERYGADFFDQATSNKFLREKGFNNNQFNFNILDDVNLKNNSQAFALVEKFYKHHLSNLNHFQANLSRRNFKNIDKLEVYKDKQTGLKYFSYFNLLNFKNIGHSIIFSEDGSIVELYISESNSKLVEGLISFKNGDLYIGKLYLDKIGFLNFEDIEPMRENILELKDENCIKNSEPININDNFTFRTNDKSKEDKIKVEKNKFENILLNDLNFNQLEKIINIHPCDEGILIKKHSSEVIISKNWDHSDSSLWNKISLCEKEKNLLIEEFHNVNSNENLSNKQFLQFFKSEKIIKKAIVYDFKNNSKYGGEVLLKNRDIIKQGKGDIEFANFTFYEGGWKNNLFHGEGVFFEKFDESLKNKSYSKSTKGTWLNGKLNGKGIITKENSSIKEVCVWRFGRLINHLKIINKKVQLNEIVLNFLSDDDLVKLIKIKNRILFNFFTKDEKHVIKRIREQKFSFVKSKTSNNLPTIPKKDALESVSFYDNYIKKNNTLETNQIVKDTLVMKSPGSNCLEENKDSDEYVDCMSQEEGDDVVKSPESEKIIKDEDSYEREIPFDPENDEENRAVYKFTNEKFKLIDSYLSRNWTIMEDKKDFKSFYFDETCGLRSIKSELIINENLHIIKEFLKDLTQRHKYNKNLDFIKNLRVIGKSYSIKYMKLKSVFILSSRDFVSAEKVVENEDQVIMISSSFESPKYPVNKGIVRGENKLAATILTKIDEKTTKVVSFSCVDIKFSQTLVNTGLKEAAKSLLTVKSLLESKK